jgi:hypothetical protein
MALIGIVNFVDRLVNERNRPSQPCKILPRPHAPAAGLRRFSKMFWLIFGTQPFAIFLARDPDFADNIFRWTELLNP